MNMKILATGSSGNAYVLEENNKLFLLDAGISLAEIKKGIKYKVSDLVATFVSHVHL